MENDHPIRVATVEDHSTYRGMLVDLFNRTPGYRCVCDCANAVEAASIVPRFRPDVVLVDLLLRELPLASQKDSSQRDIQARIAKEGRAGIECVRELKAKLPSSEFLVLTQHENTELIFQALCAGASGYCLKRSKPEELIQAVLTVHAGQTFLPPGIARYLADFFREPVRPEKLTPTEATEEKILEELKTGKPIKEIAKMLGRSEETIKTHSKRILSKLHAGSREDLLLRFGIRPRG